MSNIKSLILNFGFNDARSYGLINTLKSFAEKSYDYLFLGLSNNEFRDNDAELAVKYIPELVKNNKKFDFDFMDTAISKVMVSKIEKIFG